MHPGNPTKEKPAVKKQKIYIKKKTQQNPTTPGRISQEEFSKEIEDSKKEKHQIAKIGPAPTNQGDQVL